MEKIDLVHDDSKVGTRNKRGDWSPNAKAPITPLFWFPFKPLKFIKNLFALIHDPHITQIVIYNIIQIK